MAGGRQSAGFKGTIGSSITILGTAIIHPLGFGLIVDAFVVRMLLIPATMHLPGKTAWWFPKWLDRILPDINVEGVKIERTHPILRPAATSSAGVSEPSPSSRHEEHTIS